MKLTPEAQALRDFIREKWDAGWSAGEIALAKHCTRGVIMGHVDRMQLEKRRTVRVVKPIVPPQMPKTTKIIPPKEEPAPIGLVTDFPDRERATCRYIHGDVSSGTWQLCGVVGYPYCAFHAARFYVPQSGKSSVDKAMIAKSGILRAFGG